MNQPLWPLLRETFLRWLSRELLPYTPPPRPKPPTVTLLREEPPNVLVFSLTLPPPGASDVVTRELTQVVNGGEPIVGPATDGMELSYNDNDQVTLTLVDVDDAGNRSDASPPLSFTAVDSLPPPAPGELGVTLLREV